MRRLREAAADLVLGARCAGCDTPGSLLCDACSEDLRPSAFLSLPTPTPASLSVPRRVPPFAAGDYDGTVRSVLLAFKEQQRSRLLAPLARMLQASVVEASTRERALALVPMPSSRPAVRERGYDAVALLANRAARVLRRRGRDVRVHPVLRHRAAVSDQAGLSAPERARNLAGALRVTYPPPANRDLLLVDDVITTGASMAAAVDALRAVGAGPVAIAVVAATRRRGAARGPW